MSRVLRHMVAQLQIWAERREQASREEAAAMLGIDLEVLERQLAGLRARAEEGK